MIRIKLRNWLLTPTKAWRVLRVMDLMERAGDDHANHILHIGEAAGLSLGAVYSVAIHLENAGMVDSDWALSSPEELAKRGGRRRRAYWLTAWGRAALKADLDG